MSILCVRPPAGGADVAVHAATRHQTVENRSADPGELEILHGVSARAVKLLSASPSCPDSNNRVSWQYVCVVSVLVFLVETLKDDTMPPF